MCIHALWVKYKYLSDHVIVYTTICNMYLRVNLKYNLSTGVALGF